jgi:hypothetical protein
VALLTGNVQGLQGRGFRPLPIPHFQKFLNTPDQGEGWGTIFINVQGKYGNQIGQW